MLIGSEVEIRFVRQLVVQLRRVRRRLRSSLVQRQERAGLATHDATRCGERVCNLAYPRARDEQATEHAGREQDDHGARRPQQGTQRCADSRAQQSSGVLERVERPIVGSRAAEVQQTDRRGTHQADAETEADTLARHVLAALRKGQDRRDQGGRTRLGCGGVDAAPDGTGAVPEDPEGAQDSGDREADGRGVGAMVRELFRERFTQLAASRSPRSLAAARGLRTP